MGEERRCKYIWSVKSYRHICLISLLSSTFLLTYLIGSLTILVGFECSLESLGASDFRKWRVAS